MLMAMNKEQTPSNTAIFAVGDVHGRFDLLQAMQAAIVAQASQWPNAMHKHIVYLGDYVDRGPASAQAIEHLITQPLKGFESHYLLGNHECALLHFALPTVAFGEWALGKGFVTEDLQRMTTERMLAWFNKHGAIATLQSYGVKTPEVVEPHHLPQLQIALQQAMPQSHVDFLTSLELHCVLQNHYFVHAGVDFSQSPQTQTAWGQITIREAFLNPPQPTWPYKVVHGHTVHDNPVLLPHRVCVDIGAYMSGKLCAYMTYDENCQVLQVTL